MSQAAGEGTSDAAAGRARGRLRIYLGPAPGVGKTYAMLNEGWRRHQRGADVVVAYVESHGRPNTEAQLRDLEVIPRRRVGYRGQELEEMDTDAVLARRPAIALVDELAHTNAAGGVHSKRWEDVDDLLSAGIDVISTVNIQHLESLSDVVATITGVTQRETVPDAFVRQADQVELVDMSPESLRRRLAHGNVYPAERVDTALGNYFRAGNLSALRELALLWVADSVEEGLQDYRERHGIAAPWETKERVVVALTGSPGGDRIIRRGARMAARAHSELVGLHVRSTDGLRRHGDDHLSGHKALLAELGGRYAEVTGNDVPNALVAFARAENATQLLLGASGRGRWAQLTGGSVINEVIRQADGLDVHVISPGVEAARGGRRLPPLARRGQLTVLPPRRRIAGWILAVAGIPLVSLALVSLRGSFGPTGTLPELLLAVVVVALVGGALPALAGAVVAFGFADWYLIPPIHSFTIGRTGDAGALVSFLVVAATVSALIDLLARRGIREVRASSEAEALARLAGATVLSGVDSLTALVDELRRSFGLDSVAVLARSATAPGGWERLAASGAAPPGGVADGQLCVELGDGSVLVLHGAPPASGDRRLLDAFVAQLRTVKEREDLRVTAAAADSLAAANELRGALLSAVSHDLRTPLASIKACATSLLSDEVDWPPATVRDFVVTIDQEVERLSVLVTNLLDMSRLQSGALTVVGRPVGVDEVVHAALASLSQPTADVDVDVDESLPPILADPALLERAIANLVANALSFHRPGSRILVQAGAVGANVDLRVVDTGPGIPPAEREAVFRPFQRLGDGGSAPVEGVGLGLAVARGFVVAMHGEITLDDTPGGGLTAVVTMPLASVVSDR